ncbi:ribokinase [Terriglobus roseus]|nr:ribokinase [Terriglobus roseus]
MSVILVVGSINLDLVSTVDRIPTPGETLLGSSFATIPGGKGANQAVAAARLGAAVHMIGRVGADSFGEVLRNALIVEGIDTSTVVTVEGPSGVAAITVAADGTNSIVVTPAANATLQPADIAAARNQIRKASIVLAQLETPLETITALAQECREAKIPLILDPAPAQPLPLELLRSVTWLTPNESETRTLLGRTTVMTEAKAAERLLALGARNVILKLGPRGVYLAGADVPTPAFVPSPDLRAVDTTAAGDCFNGAFAVALTEGRSPVEAAGFACAAAALSITRTGAQTGMPYRSDVNKLLRSLT